MNPSTGTFISMDTYEGSIYDPDTLHKYLYANGNPVKYSDPTGNFFSGIGSFMATTIHTTLNNAAKLNVMGVISGVTSSAITTFLGGNTDDAIKSFIVGYIGGFGMGAVLCVAAAYGVVVYAQMLLLTTTASVAMTVTMMVYSVITHKEKETLVYGTLAIVSLISLYQAYNLYGSITIIGSKGSAKIGWEYSNPEKVQAEKGATTEKLAGGNKNHLNGSIAEINGYNIAQQNGEIGIQPPGKVTANGPDFITYNVKTKHINIWDAKYSSTGRWPKSAKGFGTQKWLEETRLAIESIADPEFRNEVLDAFENGRIDWIIFEWPQ